MAVALYNKSSMPGKSRESSQLSSSSTPHAPRRKLYTSDFPAQPSVRTVLKKHIYLDETRIRLTTNTKGSASPKPVEKAQAWVEKQVTPPPSTSGKVRQHDIGECHGPQCTLPLLSPLSPFFHAADSDCKAIPTNLRSQTSGRVS